MGTKTDPGRFDCYEAALPDEPLFVLLARDATAPSTVRAWVAARLEIPTTLPHGPLRKLIAGLNPALHPDRDQLLEALDCADAMERWRAEER